MTERHHAPVFNPNVEAHAMQSLNAVMVMFQTALRPLGPETLAELEHNLARLVDCLFPIAGDTADFAGTAPMAGGQYVHPIKTGEAAVLLGRTLGMPRSKLITIATAAALMNLGYLLVKQTLVDDPHNLADGEYDEQVHTHPSLSVTALTASGLAHDTIVAIGQHHERSDGSGYPHGVLEKEICIEARILGLADTFVTLRSHAQGRAGMPAKDALRVLREGSGRLFEPYLVEAFHEVVQAYAPEDERRAGAGAAATDAREEDQAAAAARAGAQAAREEPVKAMRERNEEGAAEPGAASRHGGATLAQAPSRVEEARAPGTRPDLRVVPASAGRRARRATVRAVPRAPALAGGRRRRSLFDAEVYLRGALERM